MNAALSQSNYSLHVGDAVEVHAANANRSLLKRATVLAFKWTGDSWESDYIEERALGIVVAPEALDFPIGIDSGVADDVTIYVPKLGCVCIIREKFLRVIA